MKVLNKLYLFVLIIVIIIFTSSCEKKTNMEDQVEISSSQEESRQHNSSLEQSSDSNIHNNNNRLTQNQALDLVMDAVKGLDIYKDSDLIYACEEKVINDKDYFMFQYCYIEHSESNPMDSVTDIAYFFVNQQNGELYYTNSDLLFNDIKKFIPGTTQFIRLRQFS